MRQQAGEPTGEANTWQNSLPYLQDLAAHHRELQMLIREKQIEAALEIALILLELVEPNLKRNGIYEESKDYQKIKEMIEDIRQDNALVERRKKASQDRETYRREKNELLSRTRRLVGILLNLMYDNNLVFQKGFDLEDTWALG